jgi:uncharacterized protein (TIGR00251 family)
VTSRLSIWERPGTVHFKIHLQPRASADEIVGVQGDSLKVRLTSPALENRANRHLLEFLSEILDCPRSMIEISVGSRSKHKTVAVSGLSAQQILHRIAQHLVD